MINALTKNEKIMLWRRFSSPEYIKIIEIISDRAFKQFQVDLKEHLNLMASL